VREIREKYVKLEKLNTEEGGTRISDRAEEGVASRRSRGDARARGEAARKEARLTARTREIREKREDASAARDKRRGVAKALGLGAAATRGPLAGGANAPTE